MTDGDRRPVSWALARLGAAAELLSVPAGEVFALAGLCGDGLATRAQISIDGGFEALSLLSALPPEPARSQLIAELGRRDRLLGKRCAVWLDRGDRSFVELEQGPRSLSLALISAGARPVDEDLDRLAACSHAGIAVRTAGELIDPIDSIAAIADRFRPPAHHSWQLYADIGRGEPAAEILGPLAAALEIQPSQQQLIADMHPILGGRHDTRFAIRVGPGVLYPELALAYRDVEAELLIRLLVGLEINRDPGESLGRFLGALGAPDRASVVELALTGAGPPRIRFGVELTSGA